MEYSIFDYPQKLDDIIMSNIEVIISGGSGDIGRSLRERLHKLNIRTLVLSRKALPLFENEDLFIFKLGQPLSFSSYEFSKAKVIFYHTSHDFDDKRSGKDNINYKGNEIIISAASKIQNLNMIYLSTPVEKMYLKYSSVYQNQKYICENLLYNQNTIIIRPSLIVSNISSNNIFFEKISRVGLPVVIPKSKNKIAPINMDIFVNYLLTFLSGEKLSGKLVVRGVKLVSFKGYLKYYHNINALELPSSVFIAISYLLRCTNLNYLWRLSEKILGIINLPCLENISDTEDHEWKVIILDV